MAKCFKCEKDIATAVDGKSAWRFPDGVLFEGGWNFGSSVYDAMVTGVTAVIIICDGCIMDAKGTDRLKERKKK